MGDASGVQLKRGVNYLPGAEGLDEGGKMTADKSWFEMLRDPRWQKKRLEVMQLAVFNCEDCGASDKTLNVHHSYYEKGRPPGTILLSRSIACARPAT